MTDVIVLTDADKIFGNILTGIMLTFTVFLLVGLHLHWTESAVEVFQNALGGSYTNDHDRHRSEDRHSD